MGVGAEAGEGVRVPFDLNLAVLLAGFSFESYNDPPVSYSDKPSSLLGVQQKSTCGRAKAAIFTKLQ